LKQALGAPVEDLAGTTKGRTGTGNVYPSVKEDPILSHSASAPSTVLNGQSYRGTNPETADTAKVDLGAAAPRL
jgi:hypothetical protein